MERLTSFSIKEVLKDLQIDWKWLQNLSKYREVEFKLNLYIFLQNCFGLEYFSCSKDIK